MRRLAVSVVLVAFAALAQEKVEPNLVGTWVAPMPGFQMVLKLNPDGSCVFDDERGSCTARGGTLTWRGPEGSEKYAYKLNGNTMTISGGDMEMAIAFQRKGGAVKAQPEPQKEKKDEVAVKTPPAQEEAVTPPPSKGPGQQFSKDIWGVRFTAPAGWKLVEKDGTVIGGHDTEAGLLIIRYYFKTTREEAIASYNAGLHESGVNAMPTGAAKDWKAGSASGIAGELAGADGQGNQLKIRSIALFNSYGGALVVAGLTTEQHYPNLKARAEQLAATVTMQKPKEVPGGGLAGAYAFIYVSKSGSYSREAYLTLCRSGKFTRRGEMVGSAELSGGARGNAFAGSNNAGTWKAMGDGNGGTLILNFGDGSSAQVNYKTSHNPKDRSGYGAAVYFGNDLYQKTGAGDC